MSENCYKKNMLLKEKEKKYRVLAVEKEKVLVIDCIKKTMPVWKKKEDLQSLEIFEEDAFEDDLEDLEVEARMMAYQRYGMIAGILPFVAEERLRTELIEKVAEENGISKQSVRAYLCNYLAMQSVRALAPKQRCTDRPLTKDEKNFRKALNKWYYTTKKRTLKNTYTLMLKNYYCDAEGNLLEEYPSFYQFRYFFRKYNKVQTNLISREGLTAYQRDFRPLTGDGVRSFAPYVGVGMLDSTVCDIYIVNDAGGIVGRPILTACVDAYSGLCCGYSLGWEGGTYSLRDLMLNVVADKVEHCKSFGIEIKKEEWPSHKLPGKLVTDMGSEYKGETFSQITDCGTQLVNLPAYRPELKSQVEKFFDVVQGYYKPYLKGKGVVEPDFQERSTHDYRKDACLTLREFEQIIIHCILFYNSKRLLQNFPYTEEMLNEEVKPYPNKIWEWGCRQDGCNLIKVSREQIVFTLLPRTTAKFTRNGLSVNGVHFHNTDKKYREDYLKGGDCEVAFNPEDVSCVWLMEKGSYIPFELIESRYLDKNLTEVQDMKQKQKNLVKMEQGVKTQAEVDLARHIQTIADRKTGDMASVKNIRANRQKEQGKTHKDFVKEILANV